MQPVIRIQQAAQQLGVSEATIRRYERAGVIPKATRNRAGQRVYSERDLETIQRALIPEEGVKT